MNNMGYRPGQLLVRRRVVIHDSGKCRATSCLGGFGDRQEFQPGQFKEPGMEFCLSQVA